MKREKEIQNRRYRRRRWKRSTPFLQLCCMRDMVNYTFWVYSSFQLCCCSLEERGRCMPLMGPLLSSSPGPPRFSLSLFPCQSSSSSSALKPSVCVQLKKHASFLSSNRMRIQDKEKEEEQQVLLKENRWGLSLSLFSLLQQQREKNQLQRTSIIKQHLGSSAQPFSKPPTLPPNHSLALSTSAHLRVLHQALRVLTHTHTYILLSLSLSFHPLPIPPLSIGISMENLRKKMPVWNRAIFSFLSSRLIIIQSVKEKEGKKERKTFSYSLPPSAHLCVCVSVASDDYMCLCVYVDFINVEVHE